MGLLLEQFITLALAKSKVGKKFSVENVLASEEGKILKERLGKKLLILQNQLVEAAADQDQLLKFFDFNYKLKIGSTLFSKILQDLKAN